MLAGSTIRLLGATPKLHWSMAPFTTCLGMFIYSCLIVMKILCLAEIRSFLMQITIE